MDRFLERHKPPKLPWLEREDMNRTVASKESESVIKKLPTTQSPGPDGFTGEVYQTIKDSSNSQKTKEEETLYNSLYEASITLIPKPEKGFPRKEYYRPGQSGSVD